ncbi:MAG: hypothetical protein ACQEVA_15400 [Myxococcota bacterium]
MTRNDYDDKSLSVFFAVIGVLGIPPALYALFYAAVLSLAAVTLLWFPPTLGAIPVLVALIFVILFGFWLLPQYIRRAFGKEASVPPATLWRLSTVQNTLCALGALGLFLLLLTLGNISNDGWEGVLFAFVPVLWFSLLTAVSASGIPDDDE